MLAHGRVDEAIFDALRKELDDEQILEFTYITVMYSGHAVISRALKLEFDERDDPIVEVAAPDDYEAGDLGQVLSRGRD